jgi:hypothetical protein
MRAQELAKEAHLQTAYNMAAELTSAPDCHTQHHNTAEVPKMNSTRLLW